MARWADGSEAVRILLSAGTLAPRWAPLCCLPQAASSSTPFVIPQYSTPCPGCQREIPGTEAGQGGTILREQLQKAPDAQKAVYQGEHDQNGVDHAVQLRGLGGGVVLADQIQRAAGKAQQQGGGAVEDLVFLQGLYYAEMRFFLRHR